MNVRELSERAEECRTAGSYNVGSILGHSGVQRILYKKTIEAGRKEMVGKYQGQGCTSEGSLEDLGVELCQGCGVGNVLQQLLESRNGAVLLQHLWQRRGQQLRAHACTCPFSTQLCKLWQRRGWELAYATSAKDCTVLGHAKCSRCVP